MFIFVLRVTLAVLTWVVRFKSEVILALVKNGVKILIFFSCCIHKLACSSILNSV